MRDPGHDFCSTATITVAAGETVYVHVRAFNADAVIPGYLLVATYVP